METWEPEANWEQPPDLETAKSPSWETEAAWGPPPTLDTPESPPMFEKEGFADPIEYDDSKLDMSLGEKDVDHRVLLPPPMPPQLAGKNLTNFFGPCLLVLLIVS